MDEIILYHGSYAEIDKIDLALCDKCRDFGKGFYLTTSKEQARSFIKTSVIKAKQKNLIPQMQNYGFVTEFRFHPIESVSTFHFDGANSEWLYYIAINRRKNLSEMLKPLIKGQYDGYDLLIGKIANDDTNATLNDFLTGSYGPVDQPIALEVVMKMLLPNRLSEQYCFRSEKSLAMLEKIGAKRYEVQ